MISVILAACNGEQYLHEQLQSISAQTLPPDEILVGDDASDDRTPEILEQYCIRMPQLRVIRHETRLGPAGNFFSLLQEAKGDLIFFCDQDDRWHTDKIGKMAAVLTERSDILALSSAFHIIDENGTPLKVHPSTGKLRKIPLKDFLRYPAFPGMAMALRRELLPDVFARFSGTGTIHDWAVSFTAAAKGGMYFFDSSLTDYRRHQGNLSAMLAYEQPEKKKERRCALVGELIRNLESAAAFPLSSADDAGYISEMTGFEKHRLALLESGSAPALLYFELRNFRFTKLRPLVGDLAALL